MKYDGWPSALIKAELDAYSYGIGLSDGTVLVFSQVLDSEFGWVKIRIDAQFCAEPAGDPPRNDLPNVLWLQLSQIVWISDSPYGS